MAKGLTPPEARAAYLATQVCVQCGKNDGTLMLIPRDATITDKKANIFHQAIHRREALLKDRVAVCSIGCRQQELIAQGRRKPLEHGTPTMYQRHGCRCVLCKQYGLNKDKKKP